MQTCNKFGVPLWVIKRALICRINLQDKYQSFAIYAVGNILLDNKRVSHINLVKLAAGKQHCYIPFVK